MIEIDPGISFGTGKHETTQLCIKQLIKYIEGAKEAPTVLDVGCGSGILSIVALKLGAKEVVGTDLDADCMISTCDNMQVNHLDEKLGTFYVAISLMIQSFKRRSVPKNMISLLQISLLMSSFLWHLLFLTG